MAPSSVYEHATAHAEIIQITDLPQPICRDPDDDAILATASIGKADLLVTGDKDLLILESYLGVEIVTPLECLKILLSRPSLP